MSLGFSFNGIAASTYSIIAKSANRPLLPALRSRELVIPGKDGSYNFGGSKYENRFVEVDIKFIGTSYTELRSRIRSIASWLSSTGDYQELIFDDEPDKYYKAKLYSEVGLQNFFRVGEATLLFQCEPFAYAVTASSQTVNITQDDQEFIVNNAGTAETPMIITITNTGSTTVSGFSLIKRETT